MDSSDDSSRTDSPISVTWPPTSLKINPHMVSVGNFTDLVDDGPRRLYPDYNGMYRDGAVRFDDRAGNSIYLTIDILKMVESNIGHTPAYVDGGWTRKGWLGMMAKVAVANKLQEGRSANRHWMFQFGVQGEEMGREAYHFPASQEKMPAPQLLPEGTVSMADPGYEVAIDDNRLGIPEKISLPEHANLSVRPYTELIPKLKIVKQRDYEGMYAFTDIPEETTIMPSRVLWALKRPGAPTPPLVLTPRFADDSPATTDSPPPILTPVPHFEEQEWLCLWGRDIVAFVSIDGNMAAGNKTFVFHRGALHARLFRGYNINLNTTRGDFRE